MTRAVYTSVTPLPAGVTRKIVMDTLRNHVEMIDLNPLVETREVMAKPPSKATPEEYHLTWYEIVDRISYLPGVKGRVTYQGCFHDLPNGLQTHVYAPMGLDIRDRWTLGGNAPGEPRQPVEFGINAPKDGLYLREDVDLNVNKMMISFVKKNLVSSHKVLVDRLIEKAKLEDTKQYNESLRQSTSFSRSISSQSTPSSINAHLVPPSADPRYSQVSQGFTSPTQVYEDRYSQDVRGWNDQMPGQAPPYVSNPDLKPGQQGYPGSNYSSSSQLTSHDAAGPYSVYAANNPHIQELPTQQHKDPVELE